MATTKKGVEYDSEKMAAEGLSERHLLGTRAIKGNGWETWGRGAKKGLNHQTLGSE